MANIHDTKVKKPSRLVSKKTVFDEMPLSIEALAEAFNMPVRDMEMHLIAIAMKKLLLRARRLAPLYTRMRLNPQYLIAAVAETR